MKRPLAILGLLIAVSAFGNHRMRIKFIILQVGALLLFAFVASAGPLDFVRDHLGVDPTNFAFDSPPPASPQFKRVSSKPGAEEWVYERPSGATTSGPPQGIQLSYTSNKLDAVEIWTSGKEGNDKLAIEFDRLSGIGATKTNPISDGKYLLSYRGLCSRKENMVAVFRLTIIAAELRRENAQEARLAGPPYFTFGHRNSGSRGGGLQYATLAMRREGGPTSGLSLRAPPGILAQMKRIQTPNGDEYELAFKPDGSGYLPKSWRFSVAYLDRDQKRQQRAFEVSYQAPGNFEVTEAHE